jgi:aspartate/methionine/tyrosine aminotransferase
MSLPDFKLETHLSEWEFKARYHMTASDAQSMTVGDLLAMSAGNQERFQTLWLGYTESVGAPSLRAEIAATYDVCKPDDVVCFAGAEEGLYAAMHALLTPDSHAIVVTPNYQSAESVPCSLCAVDGVPLDPDDRWSLDIDHIKKLVRPNTKVISINFPHNPTGAILSRDRFDALISLCDQCGIYLFSDEVYRPLGATGTLHLPQVADVYARGLSLGVMSKAYGLPGLRVGWIACQDRALLRRMERIKHYLSICNAAPSEQLALIALQNREQILARNCGIVTENLTRLNAFFARWSSHFGWSPPDGGCVAYPRYLGGEGVEVFCQNILQDRGVLLLPASVYRSTLTQTPMDRFRIGFGRRNIEAGLAEMDAFLVSMLGTTSGNAP